jgi:hypothetical protein
MLSKQKIRALLESGNWMLRFDNEGVSYAGFRWNGVGRWTEALDWNPKARCGNGLHGQSPKGAGFCQTGERMVLCETKGKQVVVDGNKVKVRYAKIIAVNDDIPVEFFENLASVGGYLYLEGYNHPLPANLASVGGYLYLRGYNHPLPANLASVGGYLYLRGYNHPLPAKLKKNLGRRRK